MSRTTGLTLVFAESAASEVFSRRPLVRARTPGETYGGFPEPGVIDTGSDSSDPGALVFVPYCAGGPGSEWWLRLVGWSRLGGNDSGRQVWVGEVLGIFAFRAGELLGPAESPNPAFVRNQQTSAGRPVGEDDRFAEQCWAWGYGFTVRQWGAGSGCAVKVYADVGGAQKVQFQPAFAPHRPVAVNFLYGWV